MKSINTFLSLFFLIFVSSCNEANESGRSAVESDLASEDISYNSPEEPGVFESEMDGNTLKSFNTSQSNGSGTPVKKVENPGLNRKMIWKAQAEFQVEDMEKSSKNIADLCKKQNAFISEMSMTSNSHRIENNMQIRVKNDGFNDLISQLKAESIYTEKLEIKSNDVTEEFVDIESRLKTKKDVRDRYISILRNKTGSISDVIEAEEAIRRITEEIEAKEGRLRYLKDQVSFSTISLTIYQTVVFERAPDKYEKSYADDMADSFGNGWSFISLLFLGIINIWPLILGGIIVLIWLRFRKKKQMKS
ncbi:MAG: DUF4349 domain-containing protein [Crocinitomicaceae bacterium]